MQNRISKRQVRTILIAFLVIGGALAAMQPLEAQTYTVVYTFTGGTDGGNPFGTPLLYNGNIYGTTKGGGTNNNGVVYQVNFASKKEVVLHSFTGAPDGAGPLAGLIQDVASNLYGTTYSGGPTNDGTIFKITLTPQVTYTVLHNFVGPPMEGSQPAGPLVFDGLGNLYGTTYDGGAMGPAQGWGSTYEYSASGVFTTGQSFPPGGALPRGGLFRSGNKFYGTTSGGGAHSYGGTIFQTSNAMAIYTFTGGADGSQPLNGLVGDLAGNLYGTCSAGGNAPYGLGNGVVFEYNPTTGVETVLHTFTGPDGSSPAAGLFRDAQGNLYGTTMFGGTMGNGTVFKLDTTGNLTTVYNFTGGSDGSRPTSGLFVDAKGNIFGTASAGGSGGQGTIFVITPAAPPTT
jgi:uncharacterized repeat protein (TIGR03803 family)